MLFAVQIGLSSIYIVMVYLITGQPMEWERAIKFSVICLMIAIVSECFGLAIASRLNIVVSNMQFKNVVPCYKNICRYPAFWALVTCGISS